jgi:2-hydroxy-4-carboxymuconate semialdehyde hemiacetal dehydrogenase
MKICIAGEGAQGKNHMTALSQMDDIEIVSLAGGLEEDSAAFAKEWGIPHYSLNLEECLNQDGVEAVVLLTPNQVHAEQAVLAMDMGKHVLIEIPMGLTLAESEKVVAKEEETGLVCMVCHTKRFGGGEKEIYRRLRAGELHLYQIVQQTYFFRRTNTNMFGKPRTWTDELLWHQACHFIDLVYWLLDDADMEVWAQAGPDHPTLGIPMDITLGLRSQSGVVVTGAYSFNNHGPIQGSTRFIGEEESFLMAKGGFTDHQGNEISTQGGGLADQDREFFNAIAEGRKPLTSCKECLPVMDLLDRIQKSMDENRWERR